MNNFVIIYDILNGICEYYPRFKFRQKYKKYIF